MPAVLAGVEKNIGWTALLAFGNTARFNTSVLPIPSQGTTSLATADPDRESIPLRIA
jgi:hypothetical protein